MEDLARYVVEAVIREGRSYREVAGAHGVSKSWVAKLVTRFHEGGYEAIRPRSKAPHRIPHKTSPELEDRIVGLRKQLTEAGFDAGAATIGHHLGLVCDEVPSTATIWRVLHRRGFVVPQPHKRPRSSWIRFEAALPNQCWQSDVTHWKLADGTEVEICNFLDDYSRVAIASRVFEITTARDVVKVFRQAAKRWGLPASVLTDNGCVYTAWHRGGATALEVELLSLGIEFKHSRPYHPQTCGKIERFHQTLKLFLAHQPPAATIAELGAQIDRFVAYYNNVRPHRANNRMTPHAAFDARDKARPADPKIKPGKGVRVRQDRVDKDGKLTLRHAGRLHHIGVGRDHRNKRVIMLIDTLDIRIITLDGSLLRKLTLDPSFPRFSGHISCGTYGP
jgi:transposase InsO family protein/transposase-like protein